MLEPTDVRALRALEESLWRRETRFDRAYLEGVLAPEFTEFGRSGRVHDRAGTLALPAREIPAALPLAGFTARAVTADVALVTYRGEVDGQRANRSSLWRRRPGGWELVFHQGTPSP